ncbi:hypothetical protein [Rubrivirga sp. IMCC45206]|uniref:hypothetical protein n=1 Tax=Rubrivirga sp. IMCC45206 TaxID=3391614 RepID=UPI00398FF286
MATTGASGSDLAIRALLGLLILALVGVLYFVTVVPAQRAAAAQYDTDVARERMSDVRTALISYRDSLGVYPSSLDSLVLFARNDSVFAAQAGAEEDRLRAPSADSLGMATRSGRPFLYEVVEDTTGVQIYWLADPDMEADSIGSRSPNPALRNAASWE